MIVLGLLLGTVGYGHLHRHARFTFGVRELYDGINFVSVAVGMFGIAEILRNLEDGGRARWSRRRLEPLAEREDLRRIVDADRRAAPCSARRSAFCPAPATCLPRSVLRRREAAVARRPEEFGHGAIEGVAAPESANNAAAQTSFIPLLTLGLPAHPVMALMLGAFIIHGITPGPERDQDEPELFWGLIVSMWIGNLFLVLLNLPLIGIWVRMLTIPYKMLFPAIIAFASIGTYSLGLNPWDVFAIAFFGLLGYFLIKLGCEPAPLLLGFVLGPLLEDHLRRSLIISRGDLSIFVTRPISASCWSWPWRPS